MSAFKEVVCPALEKFEPDFIFVASGYDSSVNDPLGRMMVTSSGYRNMASMMIEAAEKYCNGRLVVVHEGGYSIPYVPYCGLAVIEELVNIRTEILDPNLCARYATRIIQGIKVGPSPDWLESRLKAVGLTPINNVVDVTNLVMLELGQPLHAFDYHKINENRIVVRRAEPGEVLRL